MTHHSCSIHTVCSNWQQLAGGWGCNEGYPARVLLGSSHHTWADAFQAVSRCMCGLVDACPFLWMYTEEMTSAVNKCFVSTFTRRVGWIATQSDVK